MDLDIGPHSAQLGDVHVAILEDRLLEETLALGDGQHRHELRLHVGREAGVRRGRYRQRLQLPVRADFHPAVGEFDRQPRRGETVGDRQHIRRARADQLDRPAGDPRRTGVASGFDPVGHDVIAAAVEPLDPVDREVRRSDARNLAAHRHQQIAQIDDLWFARGVEQLASPARQHRRHQRIFGRTDRHHRKAVIAPG